MLGEVEETIYAMDDDDDEDDAKVGSLEMTKFEC